MGGGTRTEVTLTGRGKKRGCVHKEGEVLGLIYICGNS